MRCFLQTELDSHKLDVTSELIHYSRCCCCCCC